jgi:type IV secretory pathway VirB9-like protein
VALPLQTLKAQNMTVNTTASSSKFQASNSNDDCGNNKKNSTPTLDIIEFCIFDNETLYYFENEFANIKIQQRHQMDNKKGQHLCLKLHISLRSI